MDRDALRQVVKREPTLNALRDEQLSPRDLTERLDHSRSTVHRVARQLEDAGLVERRNGELALTAVGGTVTDELRDFRQRVTAARRLEPLLEGFRGLDYDLPLDAFAGATLTEATPADPYRPVDRFMTLVDGTTSLRGLDPTSINPLHLDDLHRAVVAGMDTEAVFHPDVLEELVRTNPERVRTAFESGNLVLRTADDVPFALTLFDDRVGVGVYDDQTGMMCAYVDTDAEAAREWAESVFAEFQADADVFDWRTVLADD